MKLQSLFAVACAAFIAIPAYAEVKFGTKLETNTTVSSTSVDSGSTTDKVKFDNDGHVEFSLEASAKTESGFFVSGKGVGRIKVDGGFEEQDVWVSLGTPSVALKVGHWEAEKLFNKPDDVYITAVPGAVSRYEANAVRGRNPNGAGVVIKLSDALKLDARMAFDTASDSKLGDMNTLGVRPVLVYDSNGYIFKAGAEYVLTTPQDNDGKGEKTLLGFGAQACATFGNITIGGSGAMKTDGGKTLVKDDDGNVIGEDDADDVNTTSAIGHITLKNIAEKDAATLGAGYTTEDANDSDHMFIYGAYLHKLPIEGAEIKFGVSYATASDIGGKDDGSAFGGRIRFNYTF